MRISAIKLDCVCRVIASQASVPLVYVPLEAVGSKWYGESERNLSDMFKAAEALPGCIIFLDEVDSLATSRYNTKPALVFECLCMDSTRKQHICCTVCRLHTQACSYSCSFAMSFWNVGGLCSTAWC